MAPLVVQFLRGDVLQYADRWPMTPGIFRAVMALQLVALVAGFLAGYLFRNWQLLSAGDSASADAEAWQASVRRRHAERAAARAQAARGRRFVFIRPMGVHDGR